MKTAPISGFMELLPSEQAKFEVMKRKILETFRLHGFLMIETPMIERSEILLAKSGGETDKQIYGVEPPRESASSFGQALRFDQTVPLSRYIVEHENSLGFPLRGERAQHGRFREFYQCDIDILGREKLEAGYDSEIIAALIEAFRSFMRTEFQFRISNRKILSSLVKKLELEEKAEQIFRIIDRSEKVSAEKEKGEIYAIFRFPEKRTLPKECPFLLFCNASGHVDAAGRGVGQGVGNTAAVADDIQTGVAGFQFFVDFYFHVVEFYFYAIQ